MLVASSSAAPPQDTTGAVAVGRVAPDFALPGASRYGTLRDPVRLADFKGKTVVLAFFYRARTRG
jgi:peroxiredoxin